ncbi:hypothetical protein LT679_16590 [Mucilaginibacter roseus]|uniref:Uncharacterized protein n=1 Tax=Mucilaginibacter roseus TaxID=1528868 RepID=A0ABS8U8U9_9SPHI|nr:hypothetical protein [Mucilaginibacter roseus]MCD8742231.1 hypothetical protein [Mucilaginibacter roseus]
MNLQKLSNDFLNNLYLKSKNNYSEGYDATQINQLTGINQTESKNVQTYLNSKHLIELGKYKNDFNIYITSDGIDHLLKLKENKILNIIRFYNVVHVPSGGRAAAQFLYYYNIIDESDNVKYYKIMVIISDVLCINWGYPFWSQNPDRDYPNLIKILLQYAKDRIIEKLKEGTLEEFEELLMLSTGYPHSPPYNPENLVTTEQAEYEIEIGQKSISQEIKENKLAASIIETRDVVNAVFYNKHKAKLLMLNEERNLLDFFKPANTEEEFSHRIASFGEVSRNLNIDILRKITGVTDSQQKSIQLLNLFFEQNSINGNKIVETLKQIGRIRQGYPVHTDITGVIAGLAYFKINYPIQSYEDAWLILLNEYLVTLKLLYKILGNLYLVESK